MKTHFDLAACKALNIQGWWQASKTWAILVLPEDAMEAVMAVNGKWSAVRPQVFEVEATGGACKRVVEKFPSYLRSKPWAM